MVCYNKRLKRGCTILRIAVCDDNQGFVSQAEELIKSLLVSEEMCTIVSCFSGEELLDKHKNEFFDIIFLDIEMDGINGMDTAREIRKFDNKTIIVFFTGYQEFAAEGYEVNAYRFLVKNQPEYTYVKHIKSVLEEYSLKHKLFEIPNRSSKKFLYLNDIIYFEIINKTITLHTIAGKYEYSGKLSDVERQFANDALFVKTHKSFLINVEYIDIIHKNDVLLSNGDNIPLSRLYHNAVVKAYTSYMTGR